METSTVTHRVTLTKTVEVSATVEITADNEAHAKELAYALAHDNDILTWHGTGYESSVEFEITNI